MPRGYLVLSQEQKQEIISRIKDKGERVADLAKEYGVVPKTIYNLLSRLVQGSANLLELSKLKREHEALLKIVGELIVDQRLELKFKQSFILRIEKGDVDMRLSTLLKYAYVVGKEIKLVNKK